MKKNFLLRLIPVSILAVLIVINPVSAQKKIYINTDLEGISGVFKFAQTREKDTPLNIQACEYFMGDLAAVIHGLRDGGATEIIVLDGHGSQAVIPHLMDPGASYITGTPRPGPLTGLDSTFAGMVMLGYHAMNGTPDGVLHHTQSSKTEAKYWYNGVEWGEIAQSSAIAGYYSVPTIMVTGDDAACREGKKFLGNDIVTVSTKKGFARESAQLYPFEQTRKALYEGAKRAMSVIPNIKPYKPSFPLTAKKQWLDLDPKLPQPKVMTKEAVIANPLHVTNF